MNGLKVKLQNGQNIINHPDWVTFIQQPEFQQSFTIVDTLLQRFGNTFESYYTKVIGMLAQSHPDVAQGITSNLGNGPLAPINPQVPIY